MLREISLDQILNHFYNAAQLQTQLYGS
jgi:hypothetical protein